MKVSVSQSNVYVVMQVWKSDDGEAGARLVGMCGNVTDARKLMLEEHRSDLADEKEGWPDACGVEGDWYCVMYGQFREVHTVIFNREHEDVYDLQR